MIGGRPSGTTGAVLDPIFSVRRQVRIAPGATARVAFWTFVGSSREAILDLVDKHRRPPLNRHRRWPGHRRRYSSTTSTFIAMRRPSFSVWQDTSSTPHLRCVPRLKP